MMKKLHFKCDDCRWNQVGNSTCSKCGKEMRCPAIDENRLTEADMAELNRPTFGEYIIARKSINYIATYQAECVDGNQITANLALSDVPEGAAPDSIISIITEQAHSDIARSGMNATSVLVLNLSRVW